VADTASRSRYDRSLVDGPLAPAVWKLAWPTMLTNVIGGLQGIIDHVLVGHLVGYTGNAAIGVAWQLIIVVIIFINSLFTGMSVLVARFAGAGDSEKVDRTVYQAFLTAIGIAVLIMAPLGYFLSPTLLDLVNATPEVKAEALPFLRVMFLFTSGMLIFYMLSGALRSAGDARTPMVLGIVMTVLNLVLNLVLIPGLGPIPAFGTVGSAMGTVIASGLVALYAVFKLWHGGWVVSIPKGHSYRPDWAIIRSLFRFGLPTGIQGIAMNVGGVLMLSFIGSLAQSAAAQAAFAVSYTQLFSLITWTSMGLMGAAAAIAGQNLGAGRADRAEQAVHLAARFGMVVAAGIGVVFLVFPAELLAIFGMKEPAVVEIGTELLRVLSLSGLFIAVALTYTGGLQGTGDTKGPLYISIISQVVVPLGICFVIRETGTLQPLDVWVAILVGHATRCGLSFVRFRQGGWRTIAVDIDGANP
jgi:putative MATE family efflux protein